MDDRQEAKQRAADALRASMFGPPPVRISETTLDALERRIVAAEERRDARNRDR